MGKVCKSPDLRYDRPRSLTKRPRTTWKCVFWFPLLDLFLLSFPSTMCVPDILPSFHETFAREHMRAKAFAPTLALSGCGCVCVSKCVQILGRIYAFPSACRIRCAGDRFSSRHWWVSDELSIKPSHTKRTPSLIDGLIDHGPPQRMVSLSSVIPSNER